MEVYISHDEIVEMAKRIAGEINDKFNGKNPLLVCVLKGAAAFHAELVKHIDIDVELEYIQASSYEGTKSTGVVVLKKDLDTDIYGRDVILVEDIVDTGLTMSTARAELAQRHPRSLTFVTMLDKPSRRVVEFTPDYVGRTIDDLFVFGFGLDVDEKYRHLKDICVFKEHKH